MSHLEVARVADAPQAPSARGMTYSAADESVIGAAAMRATAASMQPEELLGEFGAEEPQLVSNGAADDVVQQPVRVERTPGRNEPCYCGSGKKYKLCHGR